MIARMHHFRITTALIVLLTTTGAAMAQLPRLPGDAKPGNVSPLIAYGIALILIALVGIAAFKSSKRSHQD